jgi:hypothetical protein
MKLLSVPTDFLGIGIFDKSSLVFCIVHYNVTHTVLLYNANLVILTFEPTYAADLIQQAIE